MNLSFQDSTYSSSNKPSTATLKADLQTIETDFNSHVADSTIHFTASTVWPVGSVFTSVVATNPATLLGFGTWSSIAAGRMLIGLDSGDTQFDTVEETGGAETVTLTTTELPAHTHSVPGAATSGNDAYPINSGSTSGPDNGAPYTSGSAGSGAAFSIMNPYYVVYFWKRTA